MTKAAVKWHVIGEDYCYLCDGKNDAAHVKVIRALLVDKSRKALYHGVNHGVVGYYNKHVRPATKKAWKVSIVSEHALGFHKRCGSCAKTCGPLFYSANSYFCSIACIRFTL